MSTTDLIAGESREVTKTFTDADVEAFAKLSEDHNPIHLDSDYAEETRFGRRIVHGALTTSLISAALAQFPGTVVFLGQSTTFKKPVFIGDTVTGRAWIIVAGNTPGSWILETEVTNEDREVVVSGSAEILIDE